MKSIQSSAKTMEEAVTQGLEKLGVSLGDVTIDILQEGSKGFLGLLGGKPVIVKLTVRDGVESDSVSPFSFTDAPADTAPKSKRRSGRSKAAKIDAAKEPTKEQPEQSAKPAKRQEKRSEAPVAAQPQGEVVPAPLCDPDTLEGKAQQFLLKVTSLMGVNVSVAVKRDDEGNIRVHMLGDTLGILIGRRGETLDALQYLTSLTINRGQENYTRITLDTENYRAKREEALARLANRMANRAVKTGRKVVLEPMNPYERRILHSTLQQNTSVSTHSEGEEPNRHVVITLK